jgi:hypothetical protein
MESGPRNTENPDLLVGRVRAIYLEQNLGFITHKYNQHFAFYFSGFREFTSKTGSIDLSQKKKFLIPKEGEYVLFTKEAIKPPLKEGQSPRVEFWSTTSSYYNCLSERYIKVLSMTGDVLYKGGINAFKKYIEGEGIDSDDLVIQLT